MHIAHWDWSGSTTIAVKSFVFDKWFWHHLYQLVVASSHLFF
jgi:hypothetical protein